MTPSSSLASPPVCGASDADLRYATRDVLMARCGNGVVLDELQIFRGHGRIDLAHLSPDGLHGFELKSDVDSLSRLATQVPLYSRIFDRATLVCTARHLAGVTRRVPAWWGIWLATGDGAPAIIRQGGNNPDPDPSAWAGLLRRSEMVAVLRTSAGATPRPRAGRAQLIDALVKNVDGAELRAQVRAAMLARQAGG